MEQCLQNAHLKRMCDRNGRDFNSYARMFMESVAQNVKESYSTYFKHPVVGRPRTASFVPQPDPGDLRAIHPARRSKTPMAGPPSVIK